MSAARTDAGEATPLPLLCQRILETLPSRGISMFQHFAEMSEVSVTDFRRACCLAQESLAALAGLDALLRGHLAESSRVEPGDVEAVHQLLVHVGDVLSPIYWLTLSPDGPAASSKPASPGGSTSSRTSRSGSVSSSEGSPRPHSATVVSLPPNISSYADHPFVFFVSASTATRHALASKHQHIGCVLGLLRSLLDAAQRLCPERLLDARYTPIRAAATAPLSSLSAGSLSSSASSLSASSASLSSSSKSLAGSDRNSPPEAHHVVPKAAATGSSSAGSVHSGASDKQARSSRSFEPSLLVKGKKSKGCAHSEAQLLEAIKLDCFPDTARKPSYLRKLNLSYADEQSGWTLLHAAFFHGQLDVAGLLLAAGAPLDAPSHDNNLPLHYLVRQRSADATQLLERALLAHASTPSLASCINHKNRSGETPLHAAAMKGNADAAAVLLRLGADPNSKNNRGETPLHYAVRMKNKPSCERLLAAHADPLLPSAAGTSPLALADSLALHDIVELMKV